MLLPAAGVAAAQGGVPGPPDGAKLVLAKD